MSGLSPKYWQHLVLNYSLADILADLKNDDQLFKENQHGFEFFERLLDKYGIESVDRFVFKIKDLIDTNNCLERSHLDDKENIIFTIVEGKHYHPQTFKKRLDYFDLQAWLPVAGFLLMEGLTTISEELLRDMNMPEAATTIHHSAVYIAGITALICSLPIFYEVKRDTLEEKILEEIMQVTKLLAHSLPQRFWQTEDHGAFSKQFAKSPKEISIH